MGPFSLVSLEPVMELLVGDKMLCNFYCKCSIQRKTMDYFARAISASSRKRAETTKGLLPGILFLPLFLSFFTFTYLIETGIYNTTV